MLRISIAKFSTISASLIKQLRQVTGSPINDCSPLKLIFFKKILYQNNIKFKIPSIRPSQYFRKNTMRQLNLQKRFALIIIKDINLAFVDEYDLVDSRKQVSVNGIYLNPVKKIFIDQVLSSLQLGMGEGGFRYFQVIKIHTHAELFKRFIINPIHTCVVLVFNCSIHQAEIMKSIKQRTPCIFTPPHSTQLGHIRNPQNQFHCRQKTIHRLKKIQKF